MTGSAPEDWGYLWLAQGTTGDIWKLKVYEAEDDEFRVWGKDNPLLWVPTAPYVGQRFRVKTAEDEELRVAQLGVDLPQLGTGLGPYANSVKIIADWGDDTDTEYWAPGLGLVKAEWNDDGKTNGWELLAIEDLIPPSIAVDPVRVQLPLFTDPPNLLAGVTATDNVDGNLTASIIVGGDAVDMAKVGNYIVTYNVSDQEGNASEQKTRIYEVVATATDYLILQSGWNLVAVPLVGGRQTFDGFFDGKVFGCIWAWDADQQRYQVVNDDEVDPKRGVWVYVMDICGIPLE